MCNVRGGAVKSKLFLLGWLSKCDATSRLVQKPYLPRRNAGMLVIYQCSQHKRSHALFIWYRWYSLFFCILVDKINVFVSTLSCAHAAQYKLCGLSHSCFVFLYNQSPIVTIFLSYHWFHFYLPLERVCVCMWTSFFSFQWRVCSGQMNALPSRSLIRPVFFALSGA